MTDSISVESPEVVTLCGSMRFKDLMLTVAERETAEGVIVLMPFSVVAPDDQGGEFKAMLDRLHRAKIDLADSIIVVTDQSGYFGESTRGEIEYAESLGKPVRYRHMPPAAQSATVDDTALIEKVALVFAWGYEDEAQYYRDDARKIHERVYAPVLAAKDERIAVLQRSWDKARTANTAWLDSGGVVLPEDWREHIAADVAEHGYLAADALVRKVDSWRPATEPAEATAPEPPLCPRCGGPNGDHYVDVAAPGRPVRCVRLESPEAAEAAEGDDQ